MPAEPATPTPPRHPALEAMLTRPRLSGLTVAPDGSLLVVGVATPAPDGSRYRTALWAVDPSGSTAPRQLTRSAAGESTAAFLPGGDLLFTSARPDPDAAPDSSEPPAALWRLPRSGGEAELLLAPSAGIRGVWTAAEADVVVVAAEVHLAAGTLEDDAAREQARRDAHVTARLYEADEYPVRFWDRWLGPREPALWVLDLGAEADGDLDAAVDAAVDPAVAADPGDRGRLLARGAGLRDTEVALSPDGATVVTTWARSGPRRSPDDLVTDLVAIDVASGRRRVLADDGRAFHSPAVSPGGTEVVCIAADQGAPDRAPEHTLVLVPLPDAEVERAERPRDLTPGWDRWPGAPSWTADGRGVLCTADDHGHAPVFRVDPTSREVLRLTTDGAYQDLAVPTSRSGDQTGFALRSTVATAPHPVALDLTAQEQQPVPLPSPAGDDPTGTRVERVTATAPDGAEVGSWLVLPVAGGNPSDAGGQSDAEVADAPGGAATAGQVADAPGQVADAASSEQLPLVVLLHGGPLGSWNAWHWRWNPHVWAAQGYAVLLPDPALSTGYGRAWIERGWGRWGQAPYTDVMAAVEHVAARPDIDADRVAAGGGSFGGYLANWIAGQTDRFRAIVTHASLWSLPGFHGTTDFGLFWEREFGDPYLDPARYLDSSPHLHVGRITTPMLVIHGELDVRVPISEGVTLWTDLVRHGVAARFLYFPDEHHWVLKPQHARLWYETVLAFLDEHLRERAFERPELL